MARDPLRIAVFRFEQIAPLLEARLTPGERSRLVKAAARTPVTWPSGRHAPITASTLYRWLRRYRAHPVLDTLYSRPRPASRTARAIAPTWTVYALALLEEEPARSLYILGIRLRERFRLDRAPSRASLHRALSREPRYAQLRRRAHGERKVRTRFQGAFPHDMWQGDAKAKFRVRFADGSLREFKILSMMDDCTRVIVAGLVVLEETAAAAVAVFRRAAARYGLPHRFYADRGSAYDSYVFRTGLAALGTRRIPTKSKNAPAHGKIEAYHRVLERWFVKELKHVVVRDVKHLQELFDAFLDRIYHDHPHRELRMTPRKALGDRRSDRLVSLERLREVFLSERVLVVHPKDRTVRIGGALFRVPTRHRERKARIAVDPEEPNQPFLLLPGGVREPLAPAVCVSHPSAPAGPATPLAPLQERYRGRTLPLSLSGFGLPEIYEVFSRALGRPVPDTDAEASLVSEWVRKSGPFDPRAFDAAVARVLGRLGTGRPMAQVLRALTNCIPPSQRKESP